MAGDRLWFTGPSDGMENVYKIDGLTVSEERQVGKVKTGRKKRYLIEVVVSYHSDMVCCLPHIFFEMNIFCAF